MNNNRVEELRNLAHSIDIRINLFEGYSPKNTKEYTGEILYWRYIVNVYGLFADCDRVQIKNNKTCIFELMLRYGLISRDDFNEVKEFWRDISATRKWFCHNNDDTLYYRQINSLQVEKYLKKAYVLSSIKPKDMDEIKKADWSLLNADLERRYE